MASVATAKHNTIVIYLMAAVLIWGAVSAVTVPAGEFPPAPHHLFIMSLDAVMTAILAVLLLAERGAERTAQRTAQRTGALVLGVLGVGAGLVQLGIRFTSDHAWWTGHYPAPGFT